MCTLILNGAQQRRLACPLFLISLVLLSVTSVSWSASRFVDTKQGVVVDVTSGLMWQQGNFEFVITRKEAVDYCSQLSLADETDWRLPTAKEILSLFRSRTGEIARLDTRVFSERRRAAFYWSSSVRNSGNSSMFWTVSYADSGLRLRRADAKLSTRCVRVVDINE